MRYFKIFITLIVLAAIGAGCSSSKKGPVLETMSAEEIIQLGDSKFAMGEYKEAIEAYKLIFIYHPASDMHIDARLGIAKSYGEMEEFEDQMEELLLLIRENTVPERVPEIYVQLGRFYEKAARFNPGLVTSDSTDYNTALDYYNKAIEYKDSDDPNAKAHAQYRIALVLAKLNKSNQAIEQYQYVSNRYPESVYALFAKLKLQDPNNTDDLASDELSLQKYREALGLVSEDEAVEEPTDAPMDEQNQVPGDAGSLPFESSELDSTGSAQ